MRASIILLIFLVSSFLSSAQKSKSLLYQFPEKNLSNSSVDAETLYNKIITHHFKGIPLRNLKKFAETASNEKESLFLRGKVYIGWDKMELYLNKILQKILPDSLKDNPDIHVYPARITEENAFIMFDGSIFFNVGLFANITNEASIAIILGHELGHYLMNDNLHNFMLGNKLKRKEIKAKGIDDKLQFVFEYSKYNRRQELLADSIGYILAKKAGYDPYYGIDNFKRFQIEENAEEIKKAPTRIASASNRQLNRNDILNLLKLHPENSDRIEKLNEFILNDSTSIKQKYIVSETDFLILQEIARYESLYLLLNNDLRACVKNSFIYYLFDPDNEDYLYYLVESLRRYISIDYHVKDHSFLTEDFLGQQFNKGNGILHHLSYLILDSVKFSQIKPNDLTDTSTIEFEDYKHAFEYFSKIALKQGNREAMLSIALAQEDTILQNEYLAKYLSFNNCWYKDYAIALKNNDINNLISKNTSDIILYMRPEYYDLTRFGIKRNYQYEIKVGKKILAAYPLLLGTSMPLYNLSRLDDPAYVNLNDVDHYYNLLDASKYVTKNNIVDKFDSEKKCIIKEFIKGVDIFNINPDNWEFVKKNNIKSLQQYKVYGIRDGLFSRISFYILGAILIPEIIIPLVIINGPIGCDSYYNYYSFDLAKNKRNCQNAEGYKLSKKRYFHKLKMFIQD